jgi:hypothetical protein
MGKIKILIGASAIILLQWATSATATVISVDWTGTVTGSGTPFPGIVDVGDSITGSWNYDSTAFGFLGGISGDYQTDHDSSFFINGLSGVFSNQQMTVINRTSGVDQIDTRKNSSLLQTYSGDLFSGFTPSGLQVRFTDSTGTVFSDLSLPSILNENDFDFLNDYGGASTSIAMSYLKFDIPGSGRSTVSFKIDSFSSNPISVPEPSILVLMFTGLFGLGIARRKSTNGC